MTKSNKQSLSIETFTHLFSGLSTEHTTYLTKLIEGGVPVDTWGTGERKPLEAFFKELDTGEASLKVLNGKPIRCIRVSAIDIVYTSNQKKKFRLIEARQEFTDSSGAVLTNIDGSQRIKCRQLKSSLSETVKSNEDPILGAVRGIKEELGIEVKPEKLVFIEQNIESRDSRSFAGLQTRYEITRFKWHMPSKHFKDSYKDDREVRSGERLVSHFEWIPSKVLEQVA